MSARLFVATGVIFYRVAISDALGVLMLHIFAIATFADIFRVELARGNAVVFICCLFVYLHTCNPVNFGGYQRTTNRQLLQFGFCFDFVVIFIIPTRPGEQIQIVVKYCGDGLFYFPVFVIFSVVGYIKPVVVNLAFPFLFDFEDAHQLKIRVAF